MPIRTTEQQAPEALAELIPQLTKLTVEQPTTAEIEEAIRVSRAITRALFEWAGARYSAKAQANIQCPAVHTENPDDVEAARIDRAHVHPAFAPAINNLMRRPA